MIQYKNIHVIPTYHENLDFVHEVRKIFYEFPPDVIAVEFPENLKKKILEGINHLPKISVVLYFDELLNQQLFIPITPSDSLIEAIRLGQEYGIGVEFVDLFVKNYSPDQEILPDSYPLNKISLEEFYSLINSQKKFDKEAKIQFHVKKLENLYLQDIQQQEGELLESESASIPNSNSKPDQWIHDPKEIDDLRNHYMASRLQKLITTNERILFICGMAHWEQIKIILENGEINEDLTAFSPQITAELFNIVENDLGKIMIETPNIVFQFEMFRERQKRAIDTFDTLGSNKYELTKLDHFKAIKVIIQRALDQYHETYHERVNFHKLKSLFQYIRNLALSENMIRPQLFEIVLAAKSIVSDEFAWIVWEHCKFYPSAKVDSKLDTLKFSDTGIYLRGKHFNLRRNIPLHIKKIKLPLQPKAKEKQKGEWRKQWDENRWNMVSYLPEDVFEENYFQHVRKRSLNLMRDQYIKIHEFQSSLMDGIDFRETIRNWPIAQKIFVREERPIHGDVDAVVIIFNPDDNEGEEFYPYTMMWYAEHDHESDLAIYGTFPGVELVGPGISRIELGGVASFFPPRGIPSIWSRSFEKMYPMAKTKADKLLMAALIYAQKKFITYVAENPPSAYFKSLASKIGQKIIYIPLDRFNPVSLRALRNLHVLAGKKTREYAHKYIQKRKY